MRVREPRMIEAGESEERKKEILELKRKTFQKIEELARRERELGRRKRVMIKARRKLEKLRIDLAGKEEELREKEEHLAMWETELKAIGEELAEKKALTKLATPRAHPPEKKRRLFGLGKKRKRASKSS